MTAIVLNNPPGTRPRTKSPTLGETPDKIFEVFATHITGHVFAYDFEHFPLRETETILFHGSHRSMSGIRPTARKCRFNGILKMFDVLTEIFVCTTIAGFIRLEQQRIGGD